jgi:hypothetical protein
VAFTPLLAEEYMPDLQDVWLWMNALRASLPFAIALPILVATVFATIVDWIEHHLAEYQETASQHQTNDRQTNDQRASDASRSRRATSTGWDIIGGDVRRREGT